MAKNSLRRLQDKGPRNVYLIRRIALFGGMAAVVILALLFLTQPGKPAQPAQVIINTTPVLPPAEPVNDTPLLANGTEADVNLTNDTEDSLNETEAENEAEEVENETEELENETGDESDVEDEVEEPIVRPKKSNVLQWMEIVLGGKTSAASCYIAEDTWIRLDGVVSADVDFSNHHGFVVYADWMISEKEILDSIYPRFSSTVANRETCEYKTNMDMYCCPKETCQYVKGLSDDLD